MKIIYGIFNKDNNECVYIGQTGDFKKRMYGHLSQIKNVNKRKTSNYNLYSYLNKIQIEIDTRRATLNHHTHSSTVRFTKGANLKNLSVYTSHRFLFWRFPNDENHHHE